MLIKLDELQEIGRFSSLRHKAPHFAQLTLIYARNGYGKSTVRAVLRSATEGRADYITARRKLDAPRPSTVRSSWTSGPISFSAGQWSARPQRTYVFDQEFVQQNVHIGDSVTRDNKRNLLPVVMGEEGVRLARKIVDIDQSQRDVAASLKELAGRIKGYHPSVANVPSYCSVPIPADIDARVASAARAVELAKQTVAVREKAPPKRIPVMSLSEIQAATQATLASVSGDVAARVRHHIAQHNLGPLGDRWLKFGIDHLTNEECPFCAQSIKGVDIVSAYEAYYSDAFAAVVAQRDAALTSVRRLFGASDTNWLVLLDTNEKDFLFWQSVTDVGQAPVLTVEQRAKAERGLKSLEALLEQKTTNPLTAVDIAVAEVIAAFDVINEYNRAIDIARTAIEAAKQQVQFADLAAAQTQHQKLVALKARGTEPVLSLAASYVDQEQSSQTLAIQKEQLQAELTTYAPATIAMRQAAINSLLSNFGTDFRIVDARANFVGREPNTDFAIAIGNGKVAAGERSETKPSFKTVLSAADKTTLALAFFITQVRADPNLRDAVVVFDDPFNSQDLNRQFETTSQIRSVASQAAQAIVMSHDPRFLQMIEKDAAGPLITLQLQCSTAGEGAISPWSCTDELKDMYVRNSEIIREYGGHGALLKNVTEVTVLQAIRPFLEDYIRARFPGRFPDLVMLGAMTDEIEAAGSSDPLFAHVADLRTLNEYTRPNMHGGGEVPNPDALRAQCNRVLGIIGTY